MGAGIHVQAGGRRQSCVGSNPEGAPIAVSTAPPQGSTLGLLRDHQDTATIGLVWWFGQKTGAW